MTRAICILGLLLGVAGKGRAEGINFRTDVLPVLSKAGCNAGACHGAATGQGGFRLSLLGYDPEQDYWNITREFTARRVDLDEPRTSLILRKPSNEIDHEGGRKLPRGSSEYETVLRWLQAGAPYGDPELRVAKIIVEPADHLAETSESIQLRVQAVHSDGSEREVTALALYTSNDEAIAEVDRGGLVKTLGQGLTSIMVRYGGQVTAARVAVPFGSAAESELPIQNFIDSHVAGELKRLGVPASPLSDDAEFFRRVHLDLSGRLPEAAEAEAWLERKRSEAERAEVIAKLAGSEGFVDYWTLKLADLFLISGKRGSEQPAHVYHQWLRGQMAGNAGWDEIARELVTASGEISSEGPPNFYTLANDPRDMGEHVSRIFLGTQLACARCHAHPTDRWTQKDYYDFAAYFAGITRDGNAIAEKGRGEIAYPKSGSPAMARPLGTGEHLGTAAAARREALADWMTDRSNPFFGRAMVNRVWKELLGRGFIEPVDDLRPTNPASHPALLQELSEKFAEHGYDLRWLARTIAESATYQLSSRTTPGNQHDRQLFSHAYLKPLPAQVLVDAVSQVTGVWEEFAGQPEGTRAVELPTPQTPSYTLDVLGRCGRERSCETPVSGGGGMAAALHLINGGTINQRLGSGVLAQLIKKAESPDQVIEELYLRALSRRPSEREMKFWRETLQAHGGEPEAYEDLLWTLLNCREFAFNH